jgi:uncharacterized protein YjiS (DUF1127 family)
MIRSESSTRLSSRPQQGGILATLARWRAAARQRRELANLDERALKDIGLTRDDARVEAARPFWDVSRPV